MQTGATRTAVCSDCVHWPAAVRFARSSCLLHPPADRIVHQLKYNGWRALAEPMAERMSRLELPLEVTQEVRLVVPVPTTRARLRTRGYNQAELLARALVARWRGLHLFNGLQRARAADTQTALQPLERAANVAGAFGLVSGLESIKGAHLLLVDDVLTTGATSAECAKTLVAAGARCVTVLTFARALDARRLTGR
jgi:ComF family protein